MGSVERGGKEWGVEEWCGGRVVDEGSGKEGCGSVEWEERGEVMGGGVERERKSCRRMWWRMWWTKGRRGWGCGGV